MRAKKHAVHVENNNDSVTDLLAGIELKDPQEVQDKAAMHHTPNKDFNAFKGVSLMSGIGADLGLSNHKRQNTHFEGAQKLTPLNYWNNGEKESDHSHAVPSMMDELEQL